MAAATQTARTSPQTSKMSSPKDSKSSLPVVTKTEGAYSLAAAAHRRALAPAHSASQHTRPCTCARHRRRPHRRTETMTNPSRRQQVRRRSRLAKISVSRPHSSSSQYGIYANTLIQLPPTKPTQSPQRPMRSHWHLHQSLRRRQLATHQTTSTPCTTPSRWNQTSLSSLSSAETAAEKHLVAVPSYRPSRT
jgi:hypothetical protein